MTDLELFERLALALALGVLIGLERGWHTREAPEGGRVAGVRTFSLIGLLGGLWALLAETVGPVVLGFAFLAFAVVMIVARVRISGRNGDYGITTVVAALLTFALGAVAVHGEMAVAAAGAVITALLLGVKPVLHRWIERIAYEELLAVLKLLVMSVVLLPVLPDRGYGPWQALNPYELWLMVVLIAGLSFVGYVAVRLTGERRGVLLASVAGGLVSSTAVTVTLSRLAKRNPKRGDLLAAGIGVAAATMFARMVLVAAAVDPALILPLAWPLGLAMLAAYGAAGLIWYRSGKDSPAAELELRNPFEFGTAVKFGLLLAAIMLLSRAVKAWMGDPGVYALAAVSGLADVDAINLSLARMAGGELALEVAVTGILIAALANTLVKAGIAIGIGGRPVTPPVLAILGASAAAGAIGLGIGARLAGGSG